MTGSEVRSPSHIYTRNSTGPDTWLQFDCEWRPAIPWQPYGITIGDYGGFNFIYITAGHSNMIYKLYHDLDTHQFIFIKSWECLGNPTGISNDNLFLYVVCSSDNVVRKFDFEGTQIDEWGFPDTQGLGGPMNNPTGIAVL